MFDPSAIVMAGKANRHHVMSAMPTAPTVAERPPRQRGTAVRRRSATALHRLADRLEPRRVTPSVPTA